MVPRGSEQRKGANKISYMSHLTKEYMLKESENDNSFLQTFEDKQSAVLHN